MSQYNQASIARPLSGTLATQKVLRNTYMLLAMTLAFSAVMAAVSMAVQAPYWVSMVGSLVSLGLIWFVLPRTAHSVAGLGVVFAITGLMGFGLGPVLNHYLNMANGSMIVMQSLGATAVVFVGLSAYVLTTRKDFSFMGGFLMAGLLIAVVGMLALLVAGLFGYQFSGASLALSGLVAMLMCGFILFDTSRIVNGGETNYIMATVSLYLNIYNLFISLLQLIGFANDD
ncbi:MAG: Bax inhibitor-1/YccA family protein [Gammaproteobacteria bacterium]|nr:Bax inhibitor-1/YccA family protein [Gammaproteobacteria bacterium]